MTTKHTLIDEAIAELIQLNPDIARAIGLLTMFRLLPSGPPATEPLPPLSQQQRAIEDDLPPIIPLKGKRRVGPGHFKCPLCDAKPGKPCVKISNRGTVRAEGDDSIGAPLSGGVYHTARQELSKEANR